jgi:hypothetical protein
MEQSKSESYYKVTAEHLIPVERETEVERQAEREQALREANERRQRRWAWERARQMQTGLYVYLALSTQAIKAAVNSEPNPNVRAVRQAMLINRWQQLSRDLMTGPTPAPW